MIYNCEGQKEVGFYSIPKRAEFSRVVEMASCGLCGPVGAREKLERFLDQHSERYSRENGCILHPWFFKVLQKKYEYKNSQF